jgi:hypothetical protein
MFERMKQGGYLQIDETPVKVMDPEVKGKCARGYLWFYAVPGGDVFLDFQDTRGRKAPHAQLAGFSGTIQTDAYEVYDSADNKLVENSVRVPAVGRRRWLFIGHPDAGWRSAVIYSLIVSCRRRGLNPQEYLSDVLLRLPSMDITRIDELLPEHWKPPAPAPAQS